MGTSCFVKGPGLFVAALHAIEDEKRDGDRRASGRVSGGHHTDGEREELRREGEQGPMVRAA